MEQTPQKIETAVFALSNKRPSSFMLEGSEETGMPIALDCPDSRRIASRSMYKDPATGKIVHIQHIMGSEEIEMKKQKEEGLLYLNQRDSVWITGGQMTVANEGITAGLFKFLKNHSNNGSNPNRLPDSENVFHEVKVQEFQKPKLNNDKMLLKALGLIADLYEQNGTGGIVSFDEARIDRLCGIFDVTLPTSYEDKVIALKELAIVNPASFIETEASASNEKRTALKQAVFMNVVSLIGPGASFTKTSTMFRKLSEKKEDARLEELVTYFESPLGADNYNEMLNLMKEAKEAQL